MFKPRPSLVSISDHAERLAHSCQAYNQAGVILLQAQRSNSDAVDDVRCGRREDDVDHQIPVLLGAGRQLFELLPSRIELEIVRVIDTPQATHIRYRVRR
jgi:hypothetical protein